MATIEVVLFFGMLANKCQTVKVLKHRFHKFVKNMECINAKMSLNKISGERNCGNQFSTVEVVWDGRKFGKSHLCSVSSLNWLEAPDLLKGPWDNLMR